MTVQAPIVAAHEAFRALLLALAHPGRPFVCGPSASVVDVLSAVYEPDTAVWRSQGCAVTFGRPVDVEEARLLLVAGGASDGALLAVDRGSEEHPERAATAIYLVASDGPRTAVRLSGPGVDGALHAELPLTASELADRAKACAAFPLGVDLLTIDAHGRVIGVPRTTCVEVRG